MSILLSFQKGSSISLKRKFLALSMKYCGQRFERYFLASTKQAPRSPTAADISSYTRDWVSYGIVYSDNRDSASLTATRPFSINTKVTLYNRTAHLICEASQVTISQMDHKRQPFSSHLKIHTDPSQFPKRRTSLWTPF